VSASKRSDRYGKVVPAWDWRTTPERLELMQRCVDYTMKVDKTTMLEFAVDYLLKSQVAYPLIHEGVALVLWEDAQPTSRRLNAGQEAENLAEWGALAYTARGIAYQVRWLHEDDGRDAGDYDWSDVYEVRRDYDKDTGNE